MRGAFQIAGGLAKRVCLGGIAISFAGLLACGPDTKDEDDMEPSSEAPAAAAVATPKIEAIEITRASIPDGQMILADDPAFAAGEGWDAALYEPDGSSV